MADVAEFHKISRNSLRFLDVSNTLEKGMHKAKHNALTKNLELAKDMADEQQSDLHSDQYVFSELLAKAKRHS